MESQAPSFVKVFNPIARRILKRGPLLGPNALITVRGRKSGLPRTTPIANGWLPSWRESSIKTSWSSSIAFNTKMKATIGFTMSFA